ncbi:hypothetical protein RFN29_27585 [Mesorhizobium sp. VK22B]|uniref:Glyoxalase n=1 Tax=Mesorhizobium captivum TaxID=3072319 RepID=A0ABU4Z7S3_9HYPH|nr:MULTISPECIES: hypothetical protein [unclassified Mesorhizobium]MDX8495325.1 hypothetical protein [Mesorhizobium sp. VK22B]MDX8508732.1 hypothetical protein [Mesorhizobium sp. VK22E]
MTAVYGPSRFCRLRGVGAYFGLTSRRWQPAFTIDVQGADIEGAMRMYSRAL